MSELLDKQFQFCEILPKLLEEILRRGYKYTLGCAYCVKERHHRNGSCHYVRLAIDINLFKDGVWLKDGSGHDELHDFWLKLGGAKPVPGDLNHYSVEYLGRR